MSNIDIEEDVEDPKTTCEICTEVTPWSKIFSNDDVCAHRFCTECVAKHIGVKVRDDAVSEVKCPAVDCGRALSPLSCRRILPGRVFEAWTDLLCRAAVEGSDGCYCPNNYCSELVLNECGGMVLGPSGCPNCKGVFCFHCRVIWDEYHVCRSLHWRTTEDRNFERLAAGMKWARCPGCYSYVEHKDGCHIIMCRCRTQFCYLCGRKCKNHRCDCTNYSRVIWDKNHVCGSRHRRTPEDRNFERLAAGRKWARCPGCYIYVEHKDGCHIIMCRCKTEFCYWCGRDCENHTCDCTNYSRFLNWIRVSLLLVFVCIIGISWGIYVALRHIINKL